MTTPAPDITPTEEGATVDSDLALLVAQVPTGGATQVLDWVNAQDNPQLAATAALEAEQAAAREGVAGRPRRVLTSDLKRITATEADSATTQNATADDADATADEADATPTVVYTVRGASGWNPGNAQLPDGTIVRDGAIFPTDVGLIVYSGTNPDETPREVFRSPIVEGQAAPTANPYSEGHRVETEAGTVYISQTQGGGCASCSSKTIPASWVPQGVNSAPWPAVEDE